MTRKPNDKKKCRTCPQHGGFLGALLASLAPLILKKVTGGGVRPAGSGVRPAGAGVRPAGNRYKKPRQPKKKTEHY